MCARDRDPYEVKNSHRETQLRAGKVKSACPQIHAQTLGLNAFRELDWFGQSPLALKRIKISSSILLFMKVTIPGAHGNMGHP